MCIVLALDAGGVRACADEYLTAVDPWTVTVLATSCMSALFLGILLTCVLVLVSRWDAPARVGSDVACTFRYADELLRVASRCGSTRGRDASIQLTIFLIHAQ